MFSVDSWQFTQFRRSIVTTSWTRRELTAVCWNIAYFSVFVLIWTSESEPKLISPNSFSPMGEITPTTNLFLLWKYQRVWEPDAVCKIHNIRVYLVSLAAAQWMNKDRSYFTTRLMKHLENHVLLIQPWVKWKRRVYWMHVDDTLLIGGSYIGTTPASSIFCTSFLNKMPEVSWQLSAEKIFLPLEQALRRPSVYG